MTQGFISLHRKLMDNPIWSDANYVKLWIYCLFKASHQEHDQLVGNQMVKLQRGQFVTGRFSLTEEMNKGVKRNQQLNEKTWWRHLKNLEEWKMLSIISTNKYSLVTIDKYDIYQDVFHKNVQQNDQQMSNSCPSNDQQMSTNNNVNKGNKGNKKDIYTEIKNFRLRYSDNQLKIIDSYLEMIRHTRVSAKISDSVILGMYKEWDKHPTVCVEYGLKTHTDNPAHHSKKENYTMGIIRNTKADEASSKLNGVDKPKNKVNWEEFDLE